MTIKVTAAVWLRLPLAPAMVSANVPVWVAAEVAIVSVELPEPPLIDAGLKLAVAPLGRPPTLNDTVPPNPFSGDTLTV